MRIIKKKKTIVCINYERISCISFSSSNENKNLMKVATIVELDTPFILHDVY